MTKRRGGRSLKLSKSQPMIRVRGRKDASVLGDNTAAGESMSLEEFTETDKM